MFEHIKRAKIGDYRSGFEERVGASLTARNVPFEFETHVIRHIKPAKKARYTADFFLPNGIVVEAKGMFQTEDRQKHILVKAQHPDIDIRFVFARSKSKIGKKSKTTYAMWCNKNGFAFADGIVPDAWIAEPINNKSLEAIARAGDKL